MCTFDSVTNALNLEVGNLVEAAATQLSLCALLSGLRRHIEVQSFMGSLREEGPGSCLKILEEVTSLECNFMRWLRDREKRQPKREQGYQTGDDQWVCRNVPRGRGL